jgi:hypothetical protein
MKAGLFILFFLTCICCGAQQKPLYDSAMVQPRQFNTATIEKYKENSSFQYQNELAESPSLWDMFWHWFWKTYDNIMKTEGGRTTMKVIYWLLALAALAFFVYKIRTMNRVALFESVASQQTPWYAEEENIHAISFEEAIAKAVEEENYRLAIRLHYLQCLKIVSDKNIIAWLPNKTNSAYLNEMKGTDYYQPFKAITYIFEKAWYGNSAVLPQEYEQISEQFNQFNKQMQA